MDEGPHDNGRRLRLTIGVPAGVLMIASGLFAEAVVGYADGTHSGWIEGGQWGRAGLIALVGLLGLLLVLNPFRPDPRIARVGVLAVGLIGIVVGLEAFVGARSTTIAGAESLPGPGTWMLLLSGVAFVVLRWLGAAWPESQWEAQIRGMAARRRS